MGWISRGAGATGLSLLAAAAACGGSSSQPDGSDDGGADATMQDDGPAGEGSPAEGGRFGPLTCTTPGAYDTSNGGACGVERWSIKTGTDSAAGGVALTPTPTTVPDLVKLSGPTATSSTPRAPPVESTLYALVDVTIQRVKLETDSDYHIVVNQGGSTMITEVPFPMCIKGASPWECAITRARAAIDAKYHPNMNGTDVNDVATIVGVGFWDYEHGQTGAAPNNIELHPVLAVCFGAGCSPY